MMPELSEFRTCPAQPGRRPRAATSIAQRRMIFGVAKAINGEHNAIADC